MSRMGCLNVAYFMVKSELGVLIKVLLIKKSVYLISEVKLSPGA